MKRYCVYTYYYPEDRLFLAYLKYCAPNSSGRMKVYELDAVSGYEAKKRALKLRKEEEREAAK